MSLAKAVISGTVYRAPEKRFTSNNVPISAFAMNISDTEETLVRVIAKGNLACNCRRNNTKRRQSGCRRQTSKQHGKK